MLKIKPIDVTEEISGVNLISTNIKGIYISIQGINGNRYIILFSDKKIITASEAYTDSISNKINSTGIQTPEGFSIVGILGKGTFSYGNFYTEEHYYKRVDDNLRGLGMGQLMFNIKESLDGILDKEYSRKISGINFLTRNGFKISGKIDIEGTFSKLNEDDREKLLVLMEQYYKDEFNDQVLDEIYVFQRKIEKIA